MMTSTLLSTMDLSHPQHQSQCVAVGAGTADSQTGSCIASPDDVCYNRFDFFGRAGRPQQQQQQVQQQQQSSSLQSTFGIGSSYHQQHEDAIRFNRFDYSSVGLQHQQYQQQPSLHSPFGTGPYHQHQQQQQQQHQRQFGYHSITDSASVSSLSRFNPSPPGVAPPSATQTDVISSAESTVDELLPTAVRQNIAAGRSMSKRGERKPTPDERKDERYYERREKNNAAAKRSRDARKRRTEYVAKERDRLIVEKEFLLAEVIALRSAVQKARILLRQCREGGADRLQLLRTAMLMQSENSDIDSLKLEQFAVATSVAQGDMTIPVSRKLR